MSGRASIYAAAVEQLIEAEALIGDVEDVANLKRLLVGALRRVLFAHGEDVADAELLTAVDSWLDAQGLPRILLDETVGGRLGTEPDEQLEGGT